MSKFKKLYESTKARLVSESSEHLQYLEKDDYLNKYSPTEESRLPQTGQWILGNDESHLDDDIQFIGKIGSYGYNNYTDLERVELRERYNYVNGKYQFAQHGQLGLNVGDLIDKGFKIVEIDVPDSVQTLEDIEKLFDQVNLTILDK